MKNLYIFTLNGCHHCDELKKRLKELSIPFHDIEIIKNKQIWEFVKSKTETDVVPTVFIQIDDDGGGAAYIPGKDFQDTEGIIEIIKSNQ